MASETKPTVLDLWVCPDCGHVVKRPKAMPWAWHCGVEMVRRRALVLDDAAVEAAARTLARFDGSDCFSGEAELPGEAQSLAVMRGAFQARARAVLGMEESDD